MESNESAAAKKTRFSLSANAFFRKGVEDLAPIWPRAVAAAPRTAAFLSRELSLLNRLPRDHSARDRVPPRRRCACLYCARRVPSAESLWLVPAVSGDMRHCPGTAIYNMRQIKLLPPKALCATPFSAHNLQLQGDVYALLVSAAVIRVTARCERDYVAPREPLLAERAIRADRTGDDRVDRSSPDQTCPFE